MYTYIFFKLTQPQLNKWKSKHNVLHYRKVEFEIQIYYSVKYIKKLQNQTSQLDFFFFFPSHVACFPAITLAAKDIKAILRHNEKEYCNQLIASSWLWWAELLFTNTLPFNLASTGGICLLLDFRIHHVTCFDQWIVSEVPLHHWD